MNWRRSRRGAASSSTRNFRGDDLKELVKSYKAVYKANVKHDFPQVPREQLMLAINAVFNSWNGNKAIEYRRIERITGLKGTAVNVQAMVFGNMGETSGTGVAFTRDPNTGEDTFYGDYLINAQGEDVVAGIRTPEPIDRLQKDMPKVYDELMAIRQKLEGHYKDMQDIEFTVQEGTLYMLQTRSGKRTGSSAVRIAVEMVKSGDDRQEYGDQAGLGRQFGASAPAVNSTPSRRSSRSRKASPPARAPPAARSSCRRKRRSPTPRPTRMIAILLVRKETSPEDVAGMHLAKGILTSTGGKASHAAVVARGWGKPCVVGCEAMRIDEKAGTITISGQTFKKGDFLTIDGTKGDVMVGQVPTVAPGISGSFAEFMSWADAARTLKVRTNADAPADARKAREFGAEGIGLCRTEHMFFGEDRILPMRKMILADDEKGRKAALAELEPFQKADFVGIFEAMDGLPVTIRLLDPPLHEFLPHEDKEQTKLAEVLGLSLEKIKHRVEELHEFNPMLGFRGCRLPIVFPEIGDMQVRAIIEAAVQVQKAGKSVLPEIMIPLVGTVEELVLLKKRTIAVAEEVMKQAGTKVEYLVGTMIEVPRAALVADKIAEEAQFFSFGTNDLTQLTFGYSRDDIRGFMPTYLKEKILPVDPFQSLDVNGVGQLIEMGVQKGRAARKASASEHLKVGICGEHGGDPDSVAFCHKVGMDYVSCSPFRVPIARLAAAQAALAGGQTTTRDR